MNKEEILNTLTREIDFIKSEEERPGWRPWALVTALGSLVWLLINEIHGNQSLNNSSILIHLLILLLIYDFLRTLKDHSFPPLSDKIDKRERYESEIFYLSNRGRAIANVTRSVGMLFLLITFPLPINLFFKIPFFVLYVLYGCSILVLIPKIKDIPLKKYSPPPSFFNIAWSGFILWMLISISIILIGLDYLHLNSANLKIPFILFAIINLILFIISEANSASYNPLLQRLNDLRRDLSFNKIDPVAAFEQADIAIYGRKLNHFLQSRISNILDLFNDSNKELIKINILLGQINQSNSISNLKKKAEGQQCIENLRKIFVEIFKKREGLAKFATKHGLSMMNGGVQLETKISDLYDKTIKELDVLGKRIENTSAPQDLNIQKTQ